MHALSLLPGFAPSSLDVQRSVLLVSTLDKCPEQSVLHIDQPNQANYQGPAALGKGNSMEKLVCDYILLGMVFHKGPCQVC